MPIRRRSGRMCAGRVGPRKGRLFSPPAPSTRQRGQMHLPHSGRAAERGLVLRRGGQLAEEAGDAPQPAVGGKLTDIEAGQCDRAIR